MFKKSAIAALAVAVSATAFTASASDQLANSLNVTPGVYTTAELIQLRDAREDNNKVVENFILSNADATSRASTFATDSNAAVINAYYTTNNTDGDNHFATDNFAAKANGERYVPADVTSRAQSELDTFSD